MLITTQSQWDHAISSFIIRSSLGLSFGVVFSVLLFKRRAWPALVGLGFGAGRAYEEADGTNNMRRISRRISADYASATFKRGGAATGRDGLRLVRT